MQAAAANDDPSASWLVYVLAHQRCQPYAIGVGCDHLEDVGYDAFKHGSRIMKSANRYSRDPFLLVWYEIQSDRDRALARAAQIRRWPHAWQRRLVEASNPQWLEQWKREIDVSPLLWGQVPEISPRASLPRTSDSAGSGRKTRSASCLSLVPRTGIDPEAAASCQEASVQPPLRNGRPAASVFTRSILVSAFLCALLITICVSC